MKIKLFTLLGTLFTVFLLATSCSKDSVEDPIKKIVDEAVLIEGDGSLDPRNQGIFLPIPTTNSYLYFNPKSNEEKEAIIKAVLTKYEKEFSALKKIDNSGARTEELEMADGEYTRICDPWKIIDPKDPNSPVVRWCCNKENGWCFTQRCQCAYCC